MYKFAIAPHFDYCPSILFLCKENCAKKMQKPQNRSLRIIFGCNRYESVNSMLDALQWMNVKQRICARTLIFIFKLKNHMPPSYLSDCMMVRDDVHNYPVRNACNFRLPLYRTLINNKIN